jgi:Domain of Unknown Function (DUF748)
MSNSKLKKIFIIGTCSIIITIIVVVLLASPIAKFYAKKYGEKYIGRKIKMGLVYANPFTGHVHISNLIIYESDKDSVFLSAKGLSANFALLKLLSKTVEITEVTLNQPQGIIIQNNKDFNFNDLIKRYTPVKSEKPNKIPSKFHFNMLSVKIINGQFYYREKITPINYSIKEVNIESKGMYWNVDTIAIKFSLLSGKGSGSVNGNFSINLKNMDYRLAAIVHKFDLTLIEQYFKALVNYGNISANIDADIKATGNLKDEEDLNAKGKLTINNFHLGKNPKDDYASFDRLFVKIDELNPKEHQYIFDSLFLNHPILKYERYDYLDNIQRMFGKNGANISAAYADPARFNLIIKIADYIKVLAKNFFQSDYKINKLTIYKGCLKFNDYALTEKFSIEANPLNVVTDSIQKRGKRVEVSLKSDIKPYGKISVILSINPNDTGDFDMQYHLQSLPACIFNPYLITYTSYPLDRGTIELNGKWKVRKGIIKSENHLLIIDPQISKRLINNDTRWIPSQLIMFFIRESGNIIDYEIPITGNLKNPKFHLHDAVFDMIENIFVKPATTPYRKQVKKLENLIEKSLTLKWEMRQNSLRPHQEKFVKNMAVFLLSNPEASIEVYPMQYSEKEKEHIRYFEAKKKYYLLFKLKNGLLLNEEDSLKVEKMSVKDSLFVKYLNKQVRDTMLFTIEEKCDNFIGSAIINAKFKQLNKDREDAFLSPFRKIAVENRVKINAVENNTPYNGFSYYKIVYNGELPADLIKANKQMDELNNEAPRKKFEKEREKNNIN